jgi:predicted fused transcriptional regulator/phosphomethylpyrimidine kinase
MIGEIVPLEKGCSWVEKDGKETPILPPPVDRFWEVFENALALKDDTRSHAQRTLCQELKDAVSKLQKAGISGLVPEIGANLAVSMPGAKNLEDIAAIPGRMLNFKGKIAVLGDPEMGCSSNMGGSLLGVQKHFPEARCIINLSNNEKIRNACAASDLMVVNMPEARNYRQTDADFYQDLRQTMEACTELPDIIEIPDRINLERLILVLGRNLDELIEKITDLAEML